MELEFPDDLKYQDSHEYVRLDGDVVTVGLSAFALQELGEIVFLELPQVDEAIEKGESFGSVESVKAVGELLSPITGIIEDRNEALMEAPEQLPDDPYGDGWLIKVRYSNPDELEELMSAVEYREQISADG